MTHDLHERLDDLVTGIPAYVVPDARAAWAAGARRQTRHRIAVVAGAAVIVALLAGAIAWLPRTPAPAPADSDGGGVDGYPVRIDYPYWSPTLNADPGRLAGFVDRVRDAGTYDEPLGWFGVAPDGRLWKLSRAAPGYWPALSPDGLQLGYPASRATTGRLEFEILHLADGSVTEVTAADSSYQYGTEQFPSYWSPDSRRVVVPGGYEQGRAAVIDTNGTIRRVRTALDAWPVGWADAETLAWLQLDGKRSATVILTDLRGRTVRSVPLVLPRGRTYFGQWAGTVSADGSRIAVVADTPVDEVQVYSLDTGDPIGEPVSIEGMAVGCSMSWAGSELFVPTSDVETLLVDVHGAPRVVGDPRLGTRCSQWASQALAGGSHAGVAGTLFGTSNSWLSWHWREVGLGIVAGGAVLVIPLVLRRRRQRLAPTS